MSRSGLYASPTPAECHGRDQRDRYIQPRGETFVPSEEVGREPRCSPPEAQERYFFREIPPEYPQVAQPVGRVKPSSNRVTSSRASNYYCVVQPTMAMVSFVAMKRLGVPSLSGPM
jgi:hypothetical protein